MKIVTKSTESKPITSGLSASFRQRLQTLLAIVGWAVLITITLLTALLGGWILLAAVLLRSRPTNEQPVLPIMLVLLAIMGGFAWLVAKYVSSPPNVVGVIGLIVAPMCIIGITWPRPSTVPCQRDGLGWN